jgi:hypothetical protein
MSDNQPDEPKRVSPRYTARHRHHIPGWGDTAWSEGVANGRHTHGLEEGERLGFVADCVGSPVHRHAWNISTPRRIERGYSSGPILDRTVPPPASWISKMLRR